LEEDFPQSNTITADNIGKNRSSLGKCTSLQRKNSAGGVLSGLGTPVEQPHLPSHTPEIRASRVLTL
jgi:hypothetical protein